MVQWQKNTISYVMQHHHRHLTVIVLNLLYRNCLFECQYPHWIASSWRTRPSVLGFFLSPEPSPVFSYGASTLLMLVARKGVRNGERNRWFRWHFGLLPHCYFFCTTTEIILTLWTFWGFEFWINGGLQGYLTNLNFLNALVIKQSAQPTLTMHQLINRKLQATPRFSNSCQGWLISDY